MLARIRKAGKIFEIAINSEAAQAYLKNAATLSEVLQADAIFTDLKKGDRASDSDLEAAFGTTEFLQIAEIILHKGEIQFTSEQRTAEREKIKKKLIHLLHTNASDPKTGYPHPPNRLEAALEEAKVIIDYNKPIENQLKDIIRSLQPILPLHVEQKRCIITIPAEFAGKSYNIVHQKSKVLKEEWKSDGSWEIKIEVPAGVYQELINNLNSLAHGGINIENE